MKPKKITGTLDNLCSKIERFKNPDKPKTFKLFFDACHEVLGFQVGTEHSEDGKYMALIIDENDRNIPLESMGTGVANILGIIADVCTANDKIFLIEELENDIHPKALKALLKLIEAKSHNNQFFISTHSNVLVRFLGANPKAKIFQVVSGNDFSGTITMPKSKIQEISNDLGERLKVLEDLGYDFYDYALWKGWLFLEESSAEIIIRDYLIDWFVPRLKSSIKTFSAGGKDNMSSKFEDFNRLFVFIHLEPTYKNKVWVLIDGGVSEKVIIDKFKDVYSKSGWNTENFMQLDKHDFEEYYPTAFVTQVDSVLKIQDSQKKRRAKRDLLLEVIDWIKASPEVAKEEFAKSAAEVINTLVRIETQLFG